MTPAGETRATVLVADDERVSRMVAAHTVRRAGFDVVEAENGETVRKALAEHPEIRVMVLDWMMPGDTGIEICSWLRAQPDGGERYVVLLTARDHAGDLEQALASGVDTFLGKPIEPRTLVEKIRTGLRVLALQRTLAARGLRFERALADLRQPVDRVPAPGRAPCGECAGRRRPH